MAQVKVPVIVTSLLKSIFLNFVSFCKYNRQLKLIQLATKHEIFFFFFFPSSPARHPAVQKVFVICLELPSDTKDQVGFVVTEFSEQIDTLVGRSCPLHDSSRACRRH